MKNKFPHSEAGSRSVPGQIIIGVLVIGLGLLFLLDNMNVLDFHSVSRYWPALVVLFGAVKLIDAETPHERMVFGIITLVGAAFLLNRMGFDFIRARNIWPLVLIGVGCLVVYKAVTGRQLIAAAHLKDVEHDDAVLDVTVMLGGFVRRITTPNFKGGEVTAIMGGVELDLRGSSIEGEAVVNVSAVMGGISMKVPPDWTVILNGTPIMGGFEEKTITPPNGQKRLIVKGYAIMGGVEVRN
ncbi:MAG: DUF5668 domain-containing protein [Pseudomonadota bacterium]